VRDHAAGVTLAYESSSRRAHVDTPFGASTWHQDELGRVTRLETPAGVFAWAYGADGAITQTAPNGVVTRLAGDAARATERADARGPLGSVLEIERQRDGAGRVVAVTRDGELARFGYDDAGRLVSVDGASGPRARFAYDAHGDRDRVDDV